LEAAVSLACLGSVVVFFALSLKRVWWLRIIEGHRLRRRCSQVQNSLRFRLAYAPRVMAASFRLQAGAETALFH
jgi:hypothetical protein